MSTPRAWPHVVAVDTEADALAAIFDAAAHAGLRIGWLCWSPAQPPAALPRDLERAADLGALRAVTVNARGTLAVKPRRGAAVLRDVLREHFRGCALVMVRGGDADLPSSLPSLRAVAAGFVVESAGETTVLTAETLVGRLRKPRPW